MQCWKRCYKEFSFLTNQIIVSVFVNQDNFNKTKRGKQNKYKYSNGCSSQINTWYLKNVILFYFYYLFWSIISIQWFDFFFKNLFIETICHLEVFVLWKPRINNRKFNSSNWELVKLRLFLQYTKYQFLIWWMFKVISFMNRKVTLTTDFNWKIQKNLMKSFWFWFIFSILFI